MPFSYIDKILRARVYDVIKETPLHLSKWLSKRCGNQIYLKREDLQPVFSFKIRGAYNKMVSLSSAQRERGVVTASAGNHAQGVAMSARHLNMKATIVMPTTTPEIKVQSVRHFGGKVILRGDTYDEAQVYATQLARDEGMTYVHPYDDPEVIAGQGTIGMEILRQHTGDLEAIFVPVGGGGLIAGVAAYVKYVRPEIKIIGVEPEDAACLHLALTHNRRKTLKQVGIFADGVAVRQVGKETFRVAKETVDEVILVNTDEICAAIKDIFDDTRGIAEPAGALAVAGVKKYIQRTQATGQAFVAIESGANINFDRLRHVAERAELGKQKEALFAVTIPEVPGSFIAFCRAIGKMGITEFNYRFADKHTANVFVGIELRSPNDMQTVMDRLHEKDYPVVDLSDNEMAKLHIRYMVGGHAPGLTHERIFRFEFPERPGALMTFLTQMGKRWNISLFHYRNNGAAFGRVLIGIQVVKHDGQAFGDFLHTLGYHYQEETDNPAYRLFASST